MNRFSPLGFAYFCQLIRSMHLRSSDKGYRWWLHGQSTIGGEKGSAINGIFVACRIGLQCSWSKLTGSRIRFPGAVNYCDQLPAIVCREGPFNMNTDGYARGNPGNRGFGGVVRDSNGFWMFGYVGKLEEVTYDEAQLWGVYRGLTILLERNVRKVVIETHSTTVLNWLRDGGDETCMHNDMVQDCIYMLSSLDCSIQQTVSNTNQCANWLANFGSEQYSALMVLEDYPREIGSMLVGEMVARTRE